MSDKITQLLISLDGSNWIIAGEAKSSRPKEMISLKRLEWDLRNEHRKTSSFQMKYIETKDNG